MDYKLKVKINGVEIYEASEETVEHGVVNTAPSITNVRLYNNACNGTMVIGATAQDSLVFDMLNPYKLSFDGDKVEFFIAPPDDYEASTADKIIRAVGSSKTREVIDTVEVNNNITEDEETGETPTAEDLADIAAFEAELNTDQVDLFEGEASTETSLERVTPSEWNKIGEYYVNEQKTSDDMKKVTLTCFDGFCKLSDRFSPTNMEATVQNMFNDLKTQVLNSCGITIAAYDFPSEINKPITWNYLCSYREALGYLYGLVGGYATFTADGTADISWYSYTGEVLIKDDLTSYETTSAGEMVVEEIRCNKSTNTFREDYLSVGGGQSISFVNPFLDEAMLNAIFNEYKGLRFTGANVSCEYVDSLQAGEFVRVFSSAEYENYLKLKNTYDDPSTSSTVKATVAEGMNSLGDVILISSQVINFYGNASTVITSMCQSESAKANIPMSPSDAKFANLYAETITTRDLVADKADINMLNVTNANVRDLVTGSINGSIIKDGTIIAKALSHEAVDTLSGNKVYYQAEAPEGEFKEGDTWYKTVVPTGYTGKILYVWNGSQWVGTDLDAKLLRANTITSQEIASNTITTNNLASGSVTADKLSIGASNKRLSDDSTKAYSKNVPTNGNYAKINKILGESVALNQLSANSRATTTISGITFTNNGDGSITLTGTATASVYSYAFCDNTILKTDHLYYIGGDFDSSVRFIPQWRKADGTWLASGTVSSTDYRGNLNRTDAGMFYVSFAVYSGTTVNKKIYPQVIDLTQMFGSGKEPTLEQCKEIFARFIPYNQGQLISASPINVVGSGRLDVLYGALRSAGNVHDELDLVNGKIIRRVGRVNLGSLAWGYNSTSARFTTTDYASQFIAYPNNTVPTSLLCSVYSIVNNNTVLTSGDKCISVTTTGTMVARDSAYTSASAFKSAMSGVYLHYELKTPYEEPISFKGNLVGATSTITFESNADSYGLHVPVTSEVEWWNVPNDVLGFSANKSLDSLLRRVVIDNDSVDIVDGNGNKLASYGEKTEIYDSNGIAQVSLSNRVNKIAGFDIVGASGGHDYFKSDWTTDGYDYRTWIRSAEDTDKGDTWVFSAQRKPTGSSENYLGRFYVTADGNVYAQNVASTPIMSYRENSDKSIRYTYRCEQDRYGGATISPFIVDGAATFNSVACTTSVMGGYRSADQTFTIQAPTNAKFSANAKWSINATANDSSGSGYSMLLRATVVRTNETTLTCAFMFLSTANATKNITVSFRVTGEWE